jgi:hypothetical protein
MAATFPQRITFQWLVREVPDMDEKDYQQLLNELRQRKWREVDSQSNFRGLLDALRKHSSS